jgi:hypothetical protein
MPVESALFWDNEREVTALDWPPVLTPQLEETPHPRATRSAVTAADEAVADIGFGDDGRIAIAVDPDLTEAELRATSIDSMVGAAFLPDDAAAAASDVEDIVERPRRSSRKKGPLILVGTAMTVAMSAGYTANVVGWRLPPALLEAAHPVTSFFRDLSMPSFFRDLKSVRLVGLMEKLRLAEPTNAPVAAGDSEIGPSIVGPMSDSNRPASEPMSVLQESRDQEAMTSSPALASTLASLATNEGQGPERIPAGELSRDVAYVLPGVSHHFAGDPDGAAPRGALVASASRARHRAAAHRSK